MISTKVRSRNWRIDTRCPLQVVFRMPYNLKTAAEQSEQAVLYTGVVNRAHLHAAVERFYGGRNYPPSSLPGRRRSGVLLPGVLVPPRTLPVALIRPVADRDSVRTAGGSECPCSNCVIATYGSWRPLATTTRKVAGTCATVTRNATYVSTTVAPTPGPTTTAGAGVRVGAADGSTHPGHADELTSSARRSRRLVRRYTGTGILPTRSRPLSLGAVTRTTPY